MQLQTLKLLNPLSILIVEDDKIARTIIKQDIKPYCKNFYEANEALGVRCF